LKGTEGERGKNFRGGTFDPAASPTRGRPPVLVIARIKGRSWQARRDTHRGPGPPRAMIVPTAPKGDG